MNCQEIQRRIVANVPSAGFRASVERTGHAFSPQELLKLAVDHAPDHMRRQELLSLLAENMPKIAEHARALRAHGQRLMADFLMPQEGTVYELVISEEGAFSQDRYLCADWDAAQETLRWYRAEYADLDEADGGADDCCIFKRRILREAGADGDELGWCRVGVDGAVLMVDMNDDTCEWGPCPRDCAACQRPCLNCQDDVACPPFVRPWDFVRYPGLRGWTAYGVAAPQRDPEALSQEVTVYPLSPETVHLREPHAVFCTHRHVSVATVEVVPPEALPASLQEKAAAYRAWLMEAMAAG